MGRAKLSDLAKKAAGTFRKSRSNQQQPTPEPVDIPAPPEGMEAGEAAVWVELAGRIGASRVVSEADLPAWRRFVGAVWLSDQTAADETASVGERCRAAGAALTWFTAFGATPHSRSRATKAPPKKIPDALDEFLS
jgi:hypothetical protein